jgi:galactokinase
MQSRARVDALALDVYRSRFGQSATAIARAPGRVELLGNHTDYNRGLVMSAAIDRYTVIAGFPLDDATLDVFAHEFDDHWHLPLAALDARSESAGSWRRYVGGVVEAMHAGVTPSRGLRMAIVGNIPLGTGLSSSASLEAAVAVLAKLLVDQASDIAPADRFALAHVLQRVENDVVGVASGLLDQFSVLLGQQGHALWLDCDTETYGRVPLGAHPPAIVVCDSKTSRRLAEGKYNVRRAECEQVVAYFDVLRGGVRSLRDISLEELLEHWNTLPDPPRRRARHVLTENDRVRRGISLLQSGDVRAFGALMTASHASSRDDFENSAPALDALIEAAQQAPGFLGGKLSGAGWAGCTVNLVEAQQSAPFAESVRTDYAARMGVVPDVHICHAADGAAAHRIAP